MSHHLLCRSGRYYFNRRIPNEVAEFDPRKSIRISLRTDSRKQALKLATLENEKLEEYWATLLISGNTTSLQYYHNTVNRAGLLGFPYRTSTDLAGGSSEEILKRLAYVEQKLDKPHVEAILGGIDAPQIRLNDALSKFWDLSKDKVIDKSPNQIRKWKNPRTLAINNLVHCLGNKALTDLTRDDMLKFRDWWIGRIQTENLTTVPANKNINWAKNILEAVSDHYKLKIDIEHLFKKIRLQKDDGKKRAAFTTEYINSVLLNPDNLCGLNCDAQNVLYAFAETGAGLTELVGLRSEDIFLDAEIPHIAITARKGNKLKTKFRRRIIPLVGHALDVFKLYPRGFIRYFDNPDGLSATLNKYLRENSLLPSDRHSVNSLRHSFQERLIKIEAPERVQAELMGHKFYREVYGEAEMVQKMEWLQKIQLK